MYKEYASKQFVEEYLKSQNFASEKDWFENDESSSSYIKNRTHYDSRYLVSTPEVTFNGTSVAWGYVKVADSIDFDIETVKTMTLFSNAGFEFEDTSVDVIYAYHGYNIIAPDNWWLGVYLETEEDADYYFEGNSHTGAGLYICAAYDPGEDVSFYYSFSYEMGEIHYLHPKYIKDMYYTNTENSVEITIVEEYIAENEKDNIMYSQDLEEGALYKVYLNGNSYECVAWSHPVDPIITCLGNGSLISANGCGEIVPFAVWNIPGWQNGEIWFEQAATYTISIAKIQPEIVKIPKKYIPNAIGNIRDGSGLCSIESIDSMATAPYSTALGSDTQASDYYSFAIGKNTEAKGSSSFAAGSHTLAFGSESHAEGSNTYAFGYDSHAEGNGTYTLDTAAHSEGGNTVASGLYAHAEGAGYYVQDLVYISGEAGSKTYTLSNSNSSIRIGSIIMVNDKENHPGSYAIITAYDTDALTITLDRSLSYSEALVNIQCRLFHDGFASGNYAHSEGYRTAARGEGSHSEGYNTTASSSYQHVQGKYNIEDSLSTYAHIVGNGTSSNNYSNAYTLDWDGNAWFSGDVYVGSTSGTNKDEGSVKLATINDIAQSDWNQNDETAPDYVKNRTHYEEPNTVLVEEQEIFFNGDLIDLGPATEDQFYDVGTLIITWDGVEYVCPLIEYNQGAFIAGNENLLYGQTLGDNPIPFLFGYIHGGIQISTSEINEYHTVKIEIQGAVHQIDPKFLPDSVKTQSDWNQNDEIAPDYIKNRPFYTGSTMNAEVLFEETCYLGEDFNPEDFIDTSYPQFSLPIDLLESGREYRVTYQGEEYLCEAHPHPYYTNYVIIGNGSLNNDGMSEFDTGEPFVIYTSSTYHPVLMVKLFELEGNNFTFKLEKLLPDIKQIDPKYIKDMYYETDNNTQNIICDAYIDLNNSDFQNLYHDEDLKVNEKISYLINNYTCQVKSFYGDLYLGNYAIIDAEYGEDTGEPFCIIKQYNSDSYVYTLAIKIDASRLSDDDVDFNDRYLRIVRVAPYTVKIKEEYLPSPYSKRIKDGYADSSVVLNVGELEDEAYFKDRAKGSNSVAMGSSTTKAVGSYSIAAGYGTTAYGRASFAHGDGTFAGGNNSHCEGDNNSCAVYLTGIANSTSYTVEINNSNYSSINPGSYLVYDGIIMVKILSYDKETSTIILEKTLNKDSDLNDEYAYIFYGSNGISSHAEGLTTLTVGDYSHAEGEMTASYGVASHAEGCNTIITTPYGHVEGKYNKIPEHDINISTQTNVYMNSYRYSVYNDITFSELERKFYGLGESEYLYRSSPETGIEKWILSDDKKKATKILEITSTGSSYFYATTEEHIISEKEQYAHIVGNGSSNNNRSNAYTLDWEGNAWFAGDVYVGSTSGTNKDDGSKKLGTAPFMTQVTLLASNWNEANLTQSVIVSGILANQEKQLIQCAPAGLSMSTVMNTGVYCSDQAENTLIFTCTSIPTENIVFNISWQDAIWI